MARSVGFSAPRLARLGRVLEGYVERGRVAGAVALVGRGEAVHVVSAGVMDLAAGTPIGRDAIFRIASVSKPVTAAAAMSLVEEGRLRLDEPVERWLPELAQRRVLRRIESPLDDTLPAERSITLRDLLTFRLGLGAVMAPPGRYPIQQAMAEAGIAPGPIPFELGPDIFMARLQTLPLIHQPGERWLYHTGSDILGVLIERIAGMELEAFLRERIFAPLGMKDTAFSVPAAALDRLATCYRSDPATGGLAIYDSARGGRWSRPPVFAAGGGGLVSTVDDLLAFGRMMLGWRTPGGERVLARSTLALMTSDQLTPAQKSASPFFPGFWDNRGWGFGLGVVTRRDVIGPAPGSFGWLGGTGTAWSCDPSEDLVAVLLTQRLMTGPDDTAIVDDFLTLAYQAIDD